MPNKMQSCLFEREHNVRTFKKKNYWQKWNPQKLEKKEDTIDQPGKWYIDSGSILINILFEDIFQLKIHVFHGAKFFFRMCR